MTPPLVLCYHAVSPTWRWRYSVTPEQLEAQVRALLGRGYRPATFGAAAAGGRRGRRLAVTFDDAHRSVVELAFPVLDALGVPATVFAVTDHVDAGRPLDFGRLGEFLGGPEERELAVMGWDELARLRDAGWEIGSHTRTHARLTELDDDALAAELRGSRAACERGLGAPCATLAYPFGAVDARVAHAAAAAGYAAAAAVEPPGARPRDRMRIPRVPITVTDDASTVARAASPLRRRLAAVRAGRG